MNKKNKDYDIYSIFEKQNKYKSPIEIITSGHLDNINRIVDGKIMSEITMRYGIFVDAQELVKALNYDRGQYQKGWIDGYNEATKKETKTNFDRITSSVESLAKVMANSLDCTSCPCSNESCFGCDSCEEKIKEWLQKECEE